MAHPHAANGSWTFADIVKALGVVAAILTAVGLGSGAALRVLRNYPWPLMIFVLVTLGGTLLAMLGKGPRNHWVGLVLFLLGLGALIVLAGKSSQAKERPLLFTSFETTTGGLVKITTTVKADGLTKDQLIYVASRGSERVPLNATTGELTTGGSGQPGSLLGEAAFGPNAAGGVEGTFTFEVSPALFWDVTIVASRHRGLVKEPTPLNDFSECIPVSPEAAKKVGLGCARFILPLAPIRPVVSASVTAATGTTPGTITATVSAGGVPPSQVIVVKAWNGDKQALLDQALGPDLAGGVKATITVPLGNTASEVCVVTALVPSATHHSQKDVTRMLCDRTTDMPETVGIAVVRSTTRSRTRRSIPPPQCKVGLSASYHRVVGP